MLFFSFSDPNGNRVIAWKIIFKKPLNCSFSSASHDAIQELTQIPDENIPEDICVLLSVSVKKQLSAKDRSLLKLDSLSSVPCFVWRQIVLLLHVPA